MLNLRHESLAWGGPLADEFTKMSVLVIDDDETSLKSCQAVLEDIGFGDLTFTMDGLDAKAKISQRKFDVIVLDWKLPGVSGAGLISFLRSLDAYEFVPVMVCSGMLKSKDFSLLEDLHFTCLLEKPFKSSLFQFKLKDLLSQVEVFQQSVADWLTLAKDFEGKVNQDTWDKYEKLLAQPTKIVPFVMALYRKIKDKISSELKLTYLEKALSHQGEALPLLTEYAKLLLTLDRLSDATEVLKKAQEIAPLNVNRLCLLGNIELQEIDPGQAAQSFKKALQIDPSSETAQAGEELADNTARYLTRSDVTQIPDNFASLLNAIGISIVKQQNFEEGISHYMSAMKFVDDPMRQAKLAFNLGLGYLRWQKQDDAKQWFEKSFTMSNGQFSKALHYSQKIEENLKTAAKSDGIPLTKDSPGPAQGELKDGPLSFVDFSEDDELGFESLISHKDKKKAG